MPTDKDKPVPTSEAEAPAVETEAPPKEPIVLADEDEWTRWLHGDPDAVARHRQG